jgi:hypothetical protein
MARRKRPTVNYWEIVESLIPEYLLDTVDKGMHEAMARSLHIKYPDIVNGCIIEERDKFSDLKYYFGESGKYLIERGMKRARMDFSTKITKVNLSDAKIGEDKKVKPKKKNILDFIKENEQIS